MVRDANTGRHRIVKAAVLATAIAVFAGPSAADEHSMTLIINDIPKGGLITKQDSALALAELIIASAYGAEELDRQMPLSVADEDDRWLVAGSFNQDRQCDQSGPVTLSIRKSNAAVIDIRLPFFMCVPADVQDVIDRELERRGRVEDTTK